MVPGKELRAEIFTSCTWRNRLPDELVSSEKGGVRAEVEWTCVSQGGH